MMDRYSLYSGKLVTHQGELARVIKVNPKTILVEHESGKQWKTYLANLTEAPDGSVFESKLGDPPDVTLGSLVRFKDGRYPGVFVVCAVATGGLRIARLGGDGGWYLYNVNAIKLDTVDVPEGLW